MTTPTSAATGFVYVMVNASLPDTYKIGASIYDPLLRAKQLSASTSIPSPFTVVYSRRVQFPFRVEAALHAALNDYRLNDSREFFAVPLRTIIELAERYEELPDAAPEHVIDSPETPWANLFSTFPDDGSDRALTNDERAKCAELSRRLRAR